MKKKNSRAGKTVVVDGVECTYGSGNVFADIGHPDPETALVKASLALQINTILKERGLKQTAAAKLLGIDQSKVSELSSGILRGFSLERLMRFLRTLNVDTQIVTAPVGRRRESHGGHLSLRAATRPIATRA